MVSSETGSLIRRAGELVTRANAVGTDYLALATNVLTLVQLVRGSDDRLANTVQHRIDLAVA